MTEYELRDIHMQYSLYDNRDDLWHENDYAKVKQEAMRQRHYIEHLGNEIHRLNLRIGLLEGNRIIFGDLIKAAVKKYKADGNADELIAELRSIAGEAASG